MNKISVMATKMRPLGSLTETSTTLKTPTFFVVAGGRVVGKGNTYEQASAIEGNAIAESLRNVQDYQAA